MLIEREIELFIHFTQVSFMKIIRTHPEWPKLDLHNTVLIRCSQTIEQGQKLLSFFLGKGTIAVFIFYASACYKPHVSCAVQSPKQARRKLEGKRQVLSILQAQGDWYPAVGRRLVSRQSRHVQRVSNT